MYYTLKMYTYIHYTNERQRLCGKSLLYNLGVTRGSRGREKTKTIVNGTERCPPGVYRTGLDPFVISFVR